MKRVIRKTWIYSAIPIIIWLLLLILPFLSGPADIPKEMHRQFLITVFTSNFLLLCIFYAHTYFVYPLLNRKNIIWYILSTCILVIIYLLCWKLFRTMPPTSNKTLPLRPDDFPNLPLRRPLEGPPFYIPIVSVFIVLLCSFCYRVIWNDAARQQLLKEQENVHLQTELSFLRSQISPHFMFNILNNLVALARKKSDKLEPAIINLSQLMRYMLYESDDNKVVLTKEIEYLKSYIELQMLRFGDEVKIDLHISGDLESYTIEPMLLIPFVENAFKHGTGMIENPHILISLDIQNKGHVLKFNIINKFNVLNQSKDKSSGIGLSNVERRLAILYPDKYQFRTFEQNGSFNTELIIRMDG